jgi:hypothetical protein
MLRIRHIHSDRDGKNIVIRDVFNHDIIVFPAEGMEDVRLFALVLSTKFCWELKHVLKHGWTFTGPKGEAVTPYAKTITHAIVETGKRWPDLVQFLLIEPT